MAGDRGSNSGEGRRGERGEEGGEEEEGALETLAAATRCRPCVVFCALCLATIRQGTTRAEGARFPQWELSKCKCKRAA